MFTCMSHESEKLVSISEMSKPVETHDVTLILKVTY